MPGLVYLDIAIGVIFLLLVFSLFASAIQEAISGLTGWRGRNLRRGVHWLIEGLAEHKTRDQAGSRDFDGIWNSPLIASLQGPPAVGPSLGRWAIFEIWAFFQPSKAKETETNRPPSYIPPETFAKAILGFLRDNKRLTGFTAAEIDTLAQSPHLLDKRIAAVLHGIENEQAKAEKAIAEWYDNSMARISGWYVRNTRMVLFWIGLSLAVTTNTDPLRYATELRENAALRAAVVNQASQVAALEDLEAVSSTLGIAATAEAKKNLKALTEEVRAHSAQLGEQLSAIKADAGWGHCGAGETQGRLSWSCFWKTVSGGSDIPSPVIGWLLLSFGVMMGAQFWFDLLKSFVSFRSVGAPPKPAKN